MIGDKNQDLYLERKNGREIFRELKKALEIKDEKKSVKLVWGLSDKVWFSEDGVKKDYVSKEELKKVVNTLKKEPVGQSCSDMKAKFRFADDLLNKLDGVGEE